MTVSLNKVSSLISKLQSIMDDSENTIIGVNISKHSPSHVHMESTEFLIEFPEYEIEVDDCPDYPFELKASIAGVQFIAVMSASEIVELKESIPNQWEYIQKQVQL